MSCPLCYQEVPGLSAERHIGRHLEETALFALPRIEGDGDSDDEQDTSGMPIASGGQDEFAPSEEQRYMSAEGLQVQNEGNIFYDKGYHPLEDREDLEVHLRGAKYPPRAGEDQPEPSSTIHDRQLPLGTGENRPQSSSRRHGLQDDPMTSLRDPRNPPPITQGVPVHVPVHDTTSHSQRAYIDLSDDPITSLRDPKNPPPVTQGVLVHGAAGPSQRAFIDPVTGRTVYLDPSEYEPRSQGTSRPNRQGRRR